MSRIALVHTSATLVPTFAALCAAKLPGVEVVNLVDDSLIKQVIREGELRPEVARRVLRQVVAAAETGADLVLVTCSSIGPAVEASAPFVSVPVLRVDQAMADRAVAIGSRVGVIATLSTTLEPTSDLIRRRAALANRPLELSPHLCDGAFEALMSGDTARHDSLVQNGLETLAPQVDVIVLAQASMARVAEALPPCDDWPPILSSPALAIEHLGTLLGNA